MKAMKPGVVTAVVLIMSSLLLVFAALLETSFSKKD